MKAAWVLAGTLGGFSASALAQSATLYGLVDVNYQYLKSGADSRLAGASLKRMSDGSVYGPGSRWGMRLREDLGGGLHAGAVLEAGFAAPTGAVGNGGRGFGRQSFVSLASDDLGELRLGRQFSLHDEVQGLTNPFGNTLILNPGAGSNTLTTGVVTMFIDAVRIDNLVQYISPVVNGFKFQAAMAPGEERVDRYHGVKGSYSDGPLNLALSYEWSKARVGTEGVSAAGDAVNKVLELGGNYNFGAFKVFGGVQGARKLTPGSGAIITAPVDAGGIGSQIGNFLLPGLTSPASRLAAYTLGVSMPVGALTIGTNYTHARFSNDSESGATLARFGVAGTYALSKQTLVYAGLGVHRGSLARFMNEKKVLQLGLRKAF